MTLFSKVAIPMSLTELDPVLSKEATQLFKCLLMYSGERPNPYPPAMALQVLQAGVAQPELRPEIYFQLMKQLRSNPSADSQRRYWELMALALMSFAPGAGCDDYVHVFLKAHADGAQRFLPPAPNLNPDPHPNPHPHTNANPHPHTNANPHPHPHPHPNPHPHLSPYPGAQSFLSLLHKAQYEGGQPLPTADELPTLLTGFFGRQVRSRYSMAD